MLHFHVYYLYLRNQISTHTRIIFMEINIGFYASVCTVLATTHKDKIW